MGNYYYNQIYRKARVLFVIQNCPHCLIWKRFIDGLNNDVKINKRILIVDATNFSEYGIYDNPMLRVFEKKIVKDGVMDFPVLFFEGTKVTNASSRAEVEAFIRACLHNDFIIPRENPYLFNKKCRFVKSGLFGTKLIMCDDAS